MQKPNSILMNSYTTQILIKSPIMPQKNVYIIFLCQKTYKSY